MYSCGRGFIAAISWKFVRKVNEPRTREMVHLDHQWVSAKFREFWNQVALE